MPDRRSSNQIVFKRRFNKKVKHTDSLSKIDYWKKWELFELFDILHGGEQLLNAMAGDNKESQFLKFKDDFIGELYETEGDNVADFTRMWEWFTPGKEWETFLGERGEAIRTEVFRITDKWKSNHGLPN